jgi:cadmium resistance transport/sequestration family protein
MNRLATAFTEGIIAFTASNIDDIIILLLFFSQVDRNFRPRHIFIGQYLGFAAIILLSLPGFFGGLVIPREWIGFLGLFPIAIGIKQLVKREEENTEVQTVNTVNTEFLESSLVNPVSSFLLSIFHPNTYKVASITVANGGDNISIYIPLFAGQNIASLGIILAVFFGMIGVWCSIAYLLSRQSNIGYILSRYGKAIVPFVLISLGLFIMYERGTFNLLFLQIK